MCCVVASHRVAHVSDRIAGNGKRYAQLGHQRDVGHRSQARDWPQRAFSPSCNWVRVLHRFIHLGSDLIADVP